MADCQQHTTQEPDDRHWCEVAVSEANGRTRQHAILAEILDQIPGDFDFRDDEEWVVLRCLPKFEEAVAWINRDDAHEARDG